MIAGQLGSDVPSEAVSYDAHYGWALHAIQDGHPEWLRSEKGRRRHRRGRMTVRTEFRLLMMALNLTKVHRHQIATTAV